MIVIAPDKFKGSLSAPEVCRAITEVIHEIDPSAQSIPIPMADGGEGTMELLTQFSRGTIVKLNVLDPLFRDIACEYGISADGHTAFIEMARASGLTLLKSAERNAMITTSFGTGQLIAHALDRGVKRIVLGIGGSATNDAGMGMAEALGVKFKSKTKDVVKPIGRDLIRVHSIDTTGVHSRLSQCKVTAIYDVKNPLYGPNGAAYVFARQKGASDQDIEQLDKGLFAFASVLVKQFHKDANFPGAGAGGGLPAMVSALFDCEFGNGMDFMIRFTGLDQYVRRASLAITGEGKLDSQTLSGKVVDGVARLCREHAVPCLVFTGKNELTSEQSQVLGVKDIHTLVDETTSDNDAMQHAFALLQQRARRVLPTWMAATGK